jgi:hypothetical protein
VCLVAQVLLLSQIQSHGAGGGHVRSQLQGQANMWGIASLWICENGVGVASLRDLLSMRQS